MMEVRLMLHDARVTRPEKSGEVLTLKRYDSGWCCWMTMHYSKHHDAFNAYDLQDIATSALDVYYWAALPDDPTIPTVSPQDEQAPFGCDMARDLPEVADGDAVAHMRRYSIDAPEEPDYDAYPVGE